MQKKLLIISGILVILSTILYAFILIRTAKTPAALPKETPGEVTSPLVGGKNIPVTPLILPTVSPQLAEKIDTLKLAWENLGEGFYSVKTVPLLEAPSMIPNYSIGYNEANKVFTILLYKDPLLENRQKAGADLMAILGTDTEETCKLDVQVYIPESVNVDYSQQNLKLPFCPGFIDLQGVSANNGVSNIDLDSPEENPSDIAL